MDKVDKRRILAEIELSILDMRKALKDKDWNYLKLSLEKLPYISKDGDKIPLEEIIDNVSRHTDRLQNIQVHIERTHSASIGQYEVRLKSRLIVLASEHADSRHEGLIVDTKFSFKKTDNNWSISALELNCPPLEAKWENLYQLQDAWQKAF